MDRSTLQVAPARPDWKALRPPVGAKVGGGVGEAEMDEFDSVAKRLQGTKVRLARNIMFRSVV